MHKSRATEHDGIDGITIEADAITRCVFENYLFVKNNTEINQLIRVSLIGF